MKRRYQQMRRWSTALSGVAAAASLISCAGPTVDVEIKLVSANCKQAKINPFTGVQTLRFTVYGNDVDPTVYATEVDASSGTATLPKIPAGKARNIVVVGVDAQDHILSRGETGPLDMNGTTPVTASVFLRPVDAFSPAVGADQQGSGAVCTQSSPRAAHTATVLGNGKVLLAGGFIVNGTTQTYLDSVEIFDPATGTITPSASKLSVKRAYHTATHFPGTNYTLLAGGENDTGALDTAELYDESTDTFVLKHIDSDIHLSNATRTRHVAILPVAREGASDQPPLLLLGGYGGKNAPNGASPLASAISFDINTQTFATTQITLGAGIAEATGVALEDGRILILGGWDGTNVIKTGTYLTPLASGSFGNPKTIQLNTGRVWPTAAVLPASAIGAPGIVVVTGGYTARDPGTHSLISPTQATEMIDLNTSSMFQVQAKASLTETRGQPGATILLNGKLLLTGGQETGASSVSSSQTADIIEFDPTAMKLTGHATKGPLITSRYLNRVTMLPDGSALISGGIQLMSGTPTAVGLLEVYEPPYAATSDGNPHG